MKSLLLMISATVLIVVFAMAGRPQTANAADAPCAEKPKSEYMIQACAKGKKAAKKAMKKLIRGTDYECDSCHKERKTYTKLKKGARDKFEKLLKEKNLK